jgi:Zn-dependent protease
LGFTLEPLAIPPLLFALCFHEFSHALTANRLGDPTAAAQGRLTLNPLRHLDPMGTLLLFFAGFGWARPVPVNPLNLRNPRRDMLWIAAAGPASNLAVALLSGLLLRAVVPILGGTGSLGGYATSMLIYSLQINLVLAVFNLIPLPPLDGAAVVRGLLPLAQVGAWSRIESVGPIFLLVLVGSRFILGFSLLSLIIGPPIRALSSLFTLGLMG